MDVRRELAQAGGLLLKLPCTLSQYRSTQPRVRLKGGNCLRVRARTQLLDLFCERGHFLRRRGRSGRQICADAEVSEAGLGVAELGQAHLSACQSMVVGFNDKLVVDETTNLFFFHAHLERVPLAGMIMDAAGLLENRPGEDRWPVEARQAQ